MQRVLAGCLVLGTLALVGGRLALAAPRSVPIGTFNGCPRHVVPLPGSATTYAPAARRAVLRFVRTTFTRRSRTPEHLVGATTTTVVLVRRWLPSGWIKTECGVAVWRGSVAVGVYFPAMDLPHNPTGHCSDCAHITFLTSRAPGGWTVWGDY